LEHVECGDFEPSRQQLKACNLDADKVARGAITKKQKQMEIMYPDA